MVGTWANICPQWNDNIYDGTEPVWASKQALCMGRLQLAIVTTLCMYVLCDLWTITKVCIH